MDEVLTTPELAAALRRSVSTVRDMRRRGTGPNAVRVGHAVRYLRVDVEEWLAGRAR